MACGDCCQPFNARLKTSLISLLTLAICLIFLTLTTCYLTLAEPQGDDDDFYVEQKSYLLCQLSLVVLMAVCSCFLFIDSFRNDGTMVLQWLTGWLLCCPLLDVLLSMQTALCLRSEAFLLGVALLITSLLCTGVQVFFFLTVLIFYKEMT